MAKVKTGDTVKVHYTGKLNNSDVFDSSVDADPLQFTTGQKQMIPAFEEAILDMEPGEKKTFKIPADGAYGQRRNDMIQTVKRSMFSDEIELKVGMQLTAEDPDGQPFVVTVATFDDENVTLDGNHPLAGEDLTFDVELVEIAAS
ncbi:MAG: peptidylprolyl isomerase [Planctomycetota bacterium]